MNRFSTTLLSLLVLIAIHALGNSKLPSDSTLTNPEPKVAVVETSSDIRYFNQLKIPVSNIHADPIIIHEQVLTDSTVYHRSKAFEYQQEVLRRKALVGNINNVSLLDLPVGLTAPTGDLNYTVIISKVRFNPTGGYLEAYFIFEIPQTGDKIAFHGKNIRFSHDGGIITGGRLELIGNYPIKLNDKTLLTIVGKGNTFVDFGCDGFKGMGLESEIEFSRDLIIPEDSLGNQMPEPQRVKTKFSLYAQTWNDILINISLPPFQASGLEDFGFTVIEAYLDLSDLANPPDLQFPPGYKSPFLEAGQPLMWHGFYLKRTDMKLPNSYKKNDSKERISFGVERLLIDDQGVSGAMFAENILNTGDMSGWKYTIDRVAIELVINQVKGFEFAGRITIPMLKNKDDTYPQFKYVSQRSPGGGYLYAVKVENNLRLPLLCADVNLLPGSSVVIERNREKKFVPYALLNGNLTIKPTTGIKANLSKIGFEGLSIRSSKSFDIQALGFGEGGAQTVSDYPIVISKIMLKKVGEDKIGLDLTLTINIGGSPKEEGFGGTAALTIWSKRESVPQKNAEGQVTGTNDEWKYNGIEISGIGISIVKPNVYELTGMINIFHDDPTYGDGFKGSLKGKIQTIGVEAMALFGKTPDFRYWFADALVSIETGVPMVPGIMSAYGFGGGFFFKMKQTDKQLSSTLGKSISGVTYIPDNESIGIKAIVLIGAATKAAWNGDVSLEVGLNTHGGINYITFTGNANFMTPPVLGGDKIKMLTSSSVGGKLAEKLASLLKGQVYGSVKLHFDNVNHIFHGNFEIYVNVAAGLVKGVSDGNKAGWAVIHIEKSDWYVLIGTPDQPLGLQVAKIFTSKSYFMLGKHLPGSPPPPSQVTEILGNVDLDYMREMNALESGTGFAFGLQFIVDTGDLQFLMFYGRFAAGTGLDFMIKDYGKECHCEGSTEPIGINGWYANGQAYAFVIGKIGIKVNLKFYKGNYDILDIGAAAIMQTKGPNPFWMHGVVGGHYRILGGMVKGKCNFDVTIGKDCKIARDKKEENLLVDVKMIAQVSPANGATDVDVFNGPQIAFNIPIEEVFEIQDEKQELHYFRAVLDEFSVNDNSQSIQGALQWNEGKDVVILNSDEILPGKKELKMKAIVTFEEKINDVWQKVKFDGVIVKETSETAFTTGEAPDYIPAKNVSFSYPIASQLNFYPKEYNQGFIKLKAGQSYLFEIGNEWVQKMRMTDAASQQYIESDLSYDASAKQVSFTIPSGFENAKTYNYEILNIPRQATVIDANVKRIETELSPKDSETTTTLTTKKIEGQLSNLQTKSIYSAIIRTSKYNTFLEKIRAVNLGNTFRKDVDINVFQLMAYLKGDEAWDAAEINGSPYNNKLIQMEAVLYGNQWYERYVYPLVYEGFPFFSWMTSHRKDNLGFPPVRDIYFDNVDQQAAANNETILTSIPFRDEYVAYNLSESVTVDYHDIQQQVVDYVADKPYRLTPRFSKLILEPIPYIRQGSYIFKINYVIPGTALVTSSFEWKLYNKISDSD